MAQTYEFTLDQLQNTRNARNAVKIRWIWSEKALERMDTHIAARETQDVTLATAAALMLANRGEMDSPLSRVGDLTGEYLRLISLRPLNDPEQPATRDKIKAAGASRANNGKKAVDWENAWAKSDSRFALTIDNTFVAFQAPRKQDITLLAEYTTAETKVTTDNTKLTQLKAPTEDDNNASHEPTTKVFKPGAPKAK